jgi:hypothetical protein
MMIGDKYCRACLRKCRGDRAADGPGSVHYGGLVFEDVVHLEESSRDRWATATSQAFVANGSGGAVSVVIRLRNLPLMDVPHACKHVSDLSNSTTAQPYSV